MCSQSGILFTAFEHSGDALAAAVVAQLKSRCPDLPIWAMGDQQVADAGAELLESTTHQAAMFLETFKHALSHLQRLKRLEHWLENHDIQALVPTDSPAANWSICKMVRRMKPHAKIVHLAAPQLWAWAPWRIKKMRRLTDHVLCLLPFEPAWFKQRGVVGTFVGHPLFEKSFDHGEELADTVKHIAILPGSRDTEIKKNWPTMIAAFSELRKKHGDLIAHVAALDDRIAEMIKQLGPKPMPEGVQMHIGKTHEVLALVDVVLLASGTASLQVAAHHKPMVVMYNVNQWGYKLLVKWMLTTQTYSLPNLISEWQTGERAVPELVPHFGEVDPVVEAMDDLISNKASRQTQREALQRVIDPFSRQSFDESAATRLLQVIAD
jgi:lipid-A-disaccharide synthase